MNFWQYSREESAKFEIAGAIALYAKRAQRKEVDSLKQIEMRPEGNSTALRLN